MATSGFGLGQGITSTPAASNTVGFSFGAPPASTNVGGFALGGTPTASVAWVFI